MNQYPANQKHTGRPVEAKPIWYIDEFSYQSGRWSWILQQSTIEYFKRTGYANGVMEGYLGRIGKTSPYFESNDLRGLSYFDDYREGKNGYFTFDGVVIFKVESMLPGVPMLVELKKVKSNDMEETTHAKNTYHVNVTGQGNVVTTGQNIEVEIGKMQLKGNIGRLKDQLEKHQVPADDIQEIVTIIEQEEPDATGTLPVRADSWINKMVRKALDGAWHVSIHAAGALLAEAIKGYYGM